MRDKFHVSAGNGLAVSDEDLVQEFVVQITPAKAWAIVKSILFQLEHDADFIEIAIVSKREDVKR